MNQRVTAALVVIAVWLAVPAAGAQKRGPTTPEERAAIVEVAAQLQENPLDRAVQDRRDTLLMVLIEAPDLQVPTCGDEMPWVKGKYKYANDLMLAHLFSAVAYKVENPSADEKQAHLAGLQGAIRAYQAIVRQDPKAKWQPIEALATKQDSGELAKAAPGFCKKT